MKAFLFPGFDSLDARDDRLKTLKIPQIRERMEAAEAVLRCESLKDFAAASDQTFQASLDLRIVSCVAAQVGIFESLTDLVGEDDWIVGCSLGDLARNVCAGVASFESVIRGGFDFGRSLMQTRSGETWRCSANDEISIEDLKARLPQGLYISVYQTPKHFLLAGPREHTEALIHSIGLSLRVSKLADIPLHSPIMLGVAASMRSTIESATVRAPSRRVYSSLLNRSLAKAEECAAEMTANLVQTVDWVRCLRTLVETGGVQTLINVGPAKTLLRFAERTPLNASYDALDGFELATGGASV